MIQQIHQATTNRRARFVVAGYAMMVPVDILCGAIAVLLGITVWRLPFLIPRLARTRYTVMIGELSHWHEVLLNELLFWLGDLVQLLQILCVTVLLIQAPSLMNRLWRMAKIHSKNTGFSSLIRSKGRACWDKMTANKAMCATGEVRSGVDLPDEVMLKIFSYLSFSCLVLNAAPVCCQWHNLAEDESLWKNLVLSDQRWPGLTAASSQVKKNKRKGKTYKQLFKYKHCVWQNRQKLLLGFAAKNGEEDYKLGYRYVIYQEFFFALRRIPHTVMLPAKIIGYLTTPILSYLLEWRDSFGLHLVPIGSIRSGLSQYNNFWGMQTYLLGVSACCLWFIVHDLLLLLLTPVFLAMCLTTLGGPLWQRPPSPVVLNIIDFLTGITLPFVLAYLLAYITWPLLLLLLVLDLSWSLHVWLLMFLCICICILLAVVALHWFKTASRTLLRYRPTRLWVWLGECAVSAYTRLTLNLEAIARLVTVVVKKVGSFLSATIKRAVFAVFNLCTDVWLIFRHKLLGSNNRALAFMTKSCYNHGAFGNLLLTVVVPLWMFWPLSLPYLFGSQALYIPAFLVCVRLFLAGYKVVDRNWGDKIAQFREQKLNVESVVMEIGPAEEHGIRVTVKATKPVELELKDFRLHIEGKRFWNALKKRVGAGLVSTFKLTMHPLNIKPFMIPDTFPAGSNRFDTVVSFGTEGRVHISKPTIIAKLRELQEAGDHELQLRLEYGDYNFGWTALGTLAVVTTRPSQMLSLANTNRSFTIKKEDAQVL